jgi:hypothetical protein
VGASNLGQVEANPAHTPVPGMFAAASSLAVAGTALDSIVLPLCLRATLRCKLPHAFGTACTQSHRAAASAG